MTRTMVPPSDILILFFHPLYHKSRVHRRLSEAVKAMDGVTFRNMYDLYPDFHIDIATEQELLQKLGDSMGKSNKKHSPNEHSWLDGVKKFFEDMKS